MDARAAILCAAAAAGVLALGAAQAQEDDYSPPKTPWGEPDIRGTWPVGHLTGTPFQRPDEFGMREFLSDAEYMEREARLEAAAARYENEDAQDKIGMGHWAETGKPNRRTSLITDPADGQLPALTAEGQRRSDAMRSTWQRDIAFDWVTDFDTWDRCITRGMPGSMFPFMYNNGIRIFQAPGTVALQLEMIHETRIIPTDGRTALPAQILHWMGESRGRWEGDTLVVETTNLHPGPTAVNGGSTVGAPRENNMPVGENTTIVERFTPTGPDTIDYEMTFTDMDLYEAPWTVHMPWRRNDGFGMYEYACHEANYMVRDYISASRAQRAQASVEAN